jgi:hypothetical protein
MKIDGSGVRYRKPPLLEHDSMNGEQALGVMSWQDFTAPASGTADPGFLVRVWHGLVRLNKGYGAALHEWNAQQYSGLVRGAMDEPDEVERPFMSLPFMADRREFIHPDQAKINLDTLYTLVQARKLEDMRDVGTRSVGLVTELLNTQISSRYNQDSSVVV